ncbi:MAG TPA: sulfatase-like hydrolase/transferase, partial [Rhodanobacteraceae bacterium]|nr:sulfatase-like hydrolase/transferase [Rhodanobacteraceae bacterium]
DNTILYTDHVLADVIDVLQHSHAITALWFESDHGELLPTATCNRQGHGIGTWHEFEIPALFWYSDSYASAFPRRVAGLRANADKRALSGDTFASILGMTGIDFPGLDHHRSLFSPDWRYRPRLVNQFWQSDFDHAIFGKQCGAVIPDSTPAASP